VDLQLRGRAGRQGDPGESRFFVSLQDDLLVRYGIDALIAGRVVGGNAANRSSIPSCAREIARAQRIIEGQNIEIPKTAVAIRVGDRRQRRQIMERARRSCTARRSRRSGRRTRAPARAGRRDWRGCRPPRRSGQYCCSRSIERGASTWRSAADLREGIHLVGLGGQDPLARFTTETRLAFRRMEQTIDAAVLDTLAEACVIGGRIDMERLGIKGPSSTWTYLVNDDPFRNQIGMMLTGPGKQPLPSMQRR
jgi:preprotein translocase subunit SecA